ncbi:MAG: hypothetical protein IKV34_04205 [Clostridia bacterium]|nr:hypothetical protein [Clostridia bacterium]
MLLAISAEKVPLLVGIIAVLVIHYPLAMIAVMRLLKYKHKVLPLWLWHILVQLLFIVGPIVCILVHPKTSEIKVYKAYLPPADDPNGKPVETDVTFATKKDD